MSTIRNAATAINARISRSTFGRVFRLQGSGHLLTKIRAGVTAFFTMAYIIAVNASILTQSGGKCRSAYNTCLIGIKRDPTTATATITGISTIAFGFLTNLPVALAWLVKVIPASITVASGVGIGIYAGIGLIFGSPVTPTNIAGCPLRYLNPETGACDSHKVKNPTLWIGVICGGLLTAYPMAYRIKSAIIIGIIVVSIMSWARNTIFTYFPNTPDGDEMFSFFRHVFPHPINSTLAAQDWNVAASGAHFVLALFTFLYVDIVDATATLYSMARFSGVVDPASNDFPRSTLAYCVDVMSISIGSLFGCSPVTAFIESGAGITEGGRTGLTAIMTGLCFLISFFVPIFASIPPWATGCTLILVGCMMMRQVTVSFCYSVAYGLIAGLFTYMVLNGGIYVTRKVSGLVFGREMGPPDADKGEYWTYMIG
ncbi:uncharacterized protein K444DRAFT_643045 [Hyaloscypha bicolor E]|uniref:Purine transporter n=1 Tax=Hyaloscypha bicolor E TaxID=1095630 RepID=A0A2J6TBW4_9HELO|nr:uncharacterized protein K444DRAFT_643045 [Hyaloscypha bicolor E]PMD60483.1 hypothetical protein K444DRAFT_643045 [Hyaloscypha bicolor E]